MRFDWQFLVELILQCHRRASFHTVLFWTKDSFYLPDNWNNYVTNPQRTEIFDTFRTIQGLVKSAKWWMDFWQTTSSNFVFFVVTAIQIKGKVEGEALWCFTKIIRYDEYEPEKHHI